MLKFRKMTVEDYPLMLKWLTADHVKEWWDDGEDTLEKVALHYGDAADGVEKFILIEAAGETEKNIGYFQLYRVPGGAVGIDQFIGEQEFLNKGVGTKAVRLFVEMIKRRFQPHSIILNPSPANKRAVRCYEKVGFRHYETVKNENGADAYMMKLGV